MPLPLFKYLLLFVGVLWVDSLRAQNFQCPNNLDFSTGNLNNWECYQGYSASTAPNGTLPAINNLIHVTPQNDRQQIMSGTGTDPYGGFSIKPAGANYSLRLGKDSANLAAEEVRYTIHVPQGLNDYGVNFDYALVMSGSGHALYEQPAFLIQAIDSSTGMILPCANLSYTLNTPGMLVSPVNNQVSYLPWSHGFLDISGQSGKTILVKVSALGCTQGNHFAYGYFVIKSCTRKVLQISYCNLSTGSLSLTAPIGYATYEWFQGTPGLTTKIANTTNNSLTRAISTLPTSYSCILHPIGANGCNDTLISKQISDFSIQAFPKIPCGTMPYFNRVGVNVLGASSGYNYYWNSNPCLYSGPPLTTGTSGPWTSTNLGILSVSPNSGCFPLTVYVYDSLGCFRSDSITESSKILFTIDSMRDTSLCLGASMILHPQFHPANLNYSILWTGGANTGSLINNSTTSPTYTARYGGFTTIYLTATDSNCTVIRPLNIYTPPDSLIATDKHVCQNAVFNPTVFDEYGFNYTWSPLNGIAPGQEHYYSPSITADTSITYTITADYPGCPIIHQAYHVDVDPIPVITFSADTLIKGCRDTLHIQANISPAWFPDFYYFWDNNADIDSPFSSNILFTGGYSAQLNFNVTTPVGCYQSKSIQVQVYPQKYASIIPSYTAACYDNPITLQAEGGVYYQWSPGTYLDDSTQATVTATPLTDITYTIMVSDAKGCLDTVFSQLQVRDSAYIALPGTVQLYDGQVFQFHPKTNGRSFQWYPATGLDDPQSGDPKFSPNVNSYYYVHVIDSAGCTTTDSVNILYRFGETMLSLPNAFTPGAAINNVFRIISFGNLSLHYFRIFNRWGNKVFETSDIHEGWDGTYHGTLQETGVFVYELEAVDGNGKVIRKQGNLTLIR